MRPATRHIDNVLYVAAGRPMRTKTDPTSCLLPAQVLPIGGTCASPGGVGEDSNDFKVVPFGSTRSNRALTDGTEAILGLCQLAQAPQLDRARWTTRGTS